MSTHNLCFEQKYRNFYLKTFQFLVVKFSIYLNRHVFVMDCGYSFEVPEWGASNKYHNIFCGEIKTLILLPTLTALGLSLKTNFSNSLS